MTLIDVNELKHYRKYIYFGCFVVASIIAPPDITLNLLLTLPLIILFEFSMFIARISGLRQIGLMSSNIEIKQPLGCLISFVVDANSRSYNNSIT